MQDGWSEVEWVVLISLIGGICWGPLFGILVSPVGFGRGRGSRLHVDILSISFFIFTNNSVFPMLSPPNLAPFAPEDSTPNI